MTESVAPAAFLAIALTVGIGWAKTGAPAIAEIDNWGGPVMTLRGAIKMLVVLALALPVVQAVLVWMRALVAAMGDEAGAAVVGHVGTACQIVWAVSLVGLLVVLALAVLNEEGRASSSKSQELEKREP